jgi:CheY-like chemotaxis protein
VLSADATEHQIQRLLELGATAYLTKPINVQEFLQVVDEYIADGASARAPS